MSDMYFPVGLLCLGLFAYLVYALLNAERF